MTFTCKTEGCPNEGIITEWPDGTPMVLCNPCGVWIQPDE